MAVQEIARDAWTGFLASYSRIHEGWPVTMEVALPDLGVLTEIRNMPLHGISVDGAPGKETITIMVGDSERNHTTHSVTRPLLVRHDHPADSPDERIEIESAGGTRVVLLVHSLIPAEMLDASVE